MSKIVQNQYDTNWYDFQTLLNLFKINMIRIDMILKQFQNLKSKHDKILYYLSKQYKESLVDKVTIVPWIAASKSSDQKILLDLLLEVSQTQDIRATKMTIWTNNWDVETNRNKLEKYGNNLLLEVS